MLNSYCVSDTEHVTVSEREKERGTDKRMSKWTEGWRTDWLGWGMDGRKAEGRMDGWIECSGRKDERWVEG